MLPVTQLKITNGRYKNTYIYYLLYKIEYICTVYLYNSWYLTLVQFVTSHACTIRDISRLYNSWHLELVQFVTSHACTIRDISLLYDSWHPTLVQFVTSHKLSIYVFNFEFKYHIFKCPRTVSRTETCSLSRPDWYRVLWLTAVRAPFCNTITAGCIQQLWLVRSWFEWFGRGSSCLTWFNREKPRHFRY